MKKLGKYSYLVITLVILALLAAGSAFVLDKLLHLDSYKGEILAELQKSLKRTVTYETGTYSLGLGPSFTFTKVVVQEKDGASPFITAEKLTFRLALLPLLEKRIVLKEMVLEKPAISLSRDKSGVFNISDLLKEKKEETPLQIKGFRIKKGSVRFSDLAAAPEGVTVALEETDLSLSQLTRGKNCDFKLSTYLVDAGKRGNITLSGSAKLAKPESPLSDTTINAAVLVKNLDAGRYWPYYSRYVPFHKVVGQLDADSTFKGKLTEFTSKGDMKIHGLRFDYPQIFHSVLTPKALRFSYEMELTPRDVSVKALDLTVDGLRVKGSCSIRDIHSGDPRIVAQATTSTFRLEDFYRYIPYGIIVKDTSEFIEQHIKGGTYKLNDGRLDGRVSQIVHMEAGQNYNVLAIRGTVEKGILAYGPDVPIFSNIKGELEMKGKDFLLHRMTGNFGGSPFSLEGKIADYPLDKPASYPFDMAITPGQPEIAWLLGKNGGKRLVFAGDSKLRLKGDGTTGDYRFSGDWNLAPASYSYPDLVSKPAGRQNVLSFNGSINRQEARLTSLQYNLPPLALSISAFSRFTGKNQLSMEIRSNQFQINEVALLLPAIAKYRPAGKVQASVRGESPSGNPADLHWGGNIALAGFSFRPPAPIKPVSNVTGAINFSGTTLETSQLVASLGNSIIYCKGSLSGFKNPTVTLAFSAPSLDMADLGLRTPQKEVTMTKVQGNVALKDNNLRIKSLSGQIGNTLASIKGTIENIDNPKVDITVTAPHLELDDIMLLTELEKQGSQGETPGGLSLKATIHADTGRIKELDFEKLTTTLMFENRILYLQPFELSLFRGHVSGRGRIDLGANGYPPRYQLSYNLEKVSADRFVQAFGIDKQEITGTLSMQGELTAKGKNSTDLKKTALGSLKFRCEKGSLRKFSVLSKIFSILNVSQLLRFHLPDMISGGMPYNAITATMSIQDGIISSQDFFIASDAMNISAVGKIDLPKNEVDATIGVQPLQTVDKVVNRLPVVGWILTGNKNTFLTTYFEAKGKLEDPSVKAIPVKSMTKGVFNIFKRVFELPAKIFTDTGEVLIGK
ncbi:MAG TPA: AsmA-like C-terminal domain-containing protein [Geobacteraceae bacterium]